jgi:hypothetical protein
MQRSKVGLLLAAAAAYGAYKYSRMSPTQKSDLKTRGKDFLNKNIGGVKDLFNRRKATTTNGSGY